MHKCRGSSTIEDAILMTVRDDPKVTYEELAARLDVSKGMVYREFSKLKADGRLRRAGGPKGEWVLLD